MDLRTRNKIIDLEAEERPTKRKRRAYIDLDLRRAIKETLADSPGLSQKDVARLYEVSIRTVRRIKADGSPQLVRHCCEGCGGKGYLPCVYCRDKCQRKTDPLGPVADPLPRPNRRALEVRNDLFRQMDELHLTTLGAV